MDRTARAQSPEFGGREVRRALVRAGARTLAWYGVRLLCDQGDASELAPDVATLIDPEERAGRRDPYRAVAAMRHTIARVSASVQ